MGSGGGIGRLFGGRGSVAAIGIGLGLAAGGIAIAAIVRPELTLTIALAIVAPLPIFVRVAQRRFDPFEPIQIMAVTFTILYAIRPIAELGFGIDSFIGRSTRGGFSGAALISIVSLLALYGGYAVTYGRRAAHRIKPLAPMWDTARSVRFAGWILLVAAFLTAVFAATVGPGALLHLYLGRSSNDYLTVFAVSGYVSLGPQLTIPASLILIFAFMRRRTLGTAILLFIAVGAAIFITVPRGDRTYVLALVLPLIVLPYLRKERRPSTATMVVAMLIAVMGMNVLLATRRHETRGRHGGPLNAVVDAVTHPGDQLKEFATGVDLAEFTVLELEYQAFTRHTAPLAYHPGSVVLNFLAYPLPGQLVDKPPAAGTYVVEDIFPPTGPVRASFNPALFGDFFADSGWISSLIYCFLLGIGVRILWEYFRRNESSKGIQIVFAATLPMLIILIRNSFTDAVARSLFEVGPLILCLIVCSRPPMRRLAGYRLRPAVPEPEPVAEPAKTLAP